MATNNVIIQEKIMSPVLIESEKEVIVEENIITLVEVGDSVFSKELNNKIEENTDDIDWLKSNSLTSEDVLTLTNEQAYDPINNYNPATKLYVDMKVSNVIGYVHSQNSASSMWTIQHNLRKTPSVTIIDSGGNIVQGNVQHVSENLTLINFTSSFGGKAYLI